MAGDLLTLLEAYGRAAEIGADYAGQDGARTSPSDPLEPLPLPLRAPLHAALPPPRYRSGLPASHHPPPPAPAEAHPTRAGWILLDGVPAPTALPPPLSPREILAPDPLLKAAACARVLLAAHHAFLTYRGPGYVFRWEHHAQPFELLATLRLASLARQRSHPELTALLAREDAWLAEWHEAAAALLLPRARLAATTQLVLSLHCTLLPHRSDRMFGGAPPSSTLVAALHEACPDPLLWEDWRRTDLSAHALRHRLLYTRSPAAALAECLRSEDPHLPPPPPADHPRLLALAEELYVLLEATAANLGEVTATLPLPLPSCGGCELDCALVLPRAPSTGCTHPELLAAALDPGLSCEPVTARILLRLPRACAAGTLVLGQPTHLAELADPAILELAAALAAGSAALAAGDSFLQLARELLA